MSPGSEEPRFRVPDAPSLGGSVRSALVDFYFNSWRLVPANVVWGAMLLLTVFLAYAWPIFALVTLVLLALPTAGVYRLATLIVRDRPAAFGDALEAWRRYLRPALLTGAILSVITVVLGTNLVVGFASNEPLGWGVATLAAWGLLATWIVAVPFWALLLDPLRAEMALPARLRLAAALVVLSPLRYGALLLLVVVLVFASVILFAALITLTVAFVALLSARYTLPAADRLEGRATTLLPDG